MRHLRKNIFEFTVLIATLNLAGIGEAKICVENNGMNPHTKKVLTCRGTEVDTLCAIQFVTPIVGGGCYFCAPVDDPPSRIDVRTGKSVVDSWSCKQQAVKNKLEIACTVDNAGAKWNVPGECNNSDKAQWTCWEKVTDTTCVLKISRIDKRFSNINRYEGVLQ